MQYIEKTIIGFSNLNNFLDNLDVPDENLSYYCEHRDDDQSKSVYYVQYFI